MTRHLIEKYYIRNGITIVTSDDNTINVYNDKNGHLITNTKKKMDYN